MNSPEAKLPESTAERIQRLPQRIEAFNQRLQDALHSSQRASDSVKLVAVSKTLAAEVVSAAMDLGLRHFGENYAQELAPKAEEVRELRTAESTDSAAIWHFIGHLQRNKVKYVAADMALFHALDSERLARELVKHARKNERSIGVLVQVNTSGEDSKFGVQPQNLAALVDVVQELPELELHGLMTIAKPQAKGGEARAEFAQLRKLLDSLADRRNSQAPLNELSMGMSHDFEPAVAEGATIIRIGTAIFGARQ